MKVEKNLKCNDYYPFFPTLTPFVKHYFLVATLGHSVSMSVCMSHLKCHTLHVTSCFTSELFGGGLITEN